MGMRAPGMGLGARKGREEEEEDSSNDLDRSFPELMMPREFELLDSRRSRSPREEEEYGRCGRSRARKDDGSYSRDRLPDGAPPRLLLFSWNDLFRVFCCGLFRAQ